MTPFWQNEAKMINVFKGRRQTNLARVEGALIAAFNVPAAVPRQWR
jgi:hypothetical protein